jgi:steroid 5-alpha reductase family enzyme
MKDSFLYILFSVFAFSITYSISLLTKIDLVNYAILLSFLLQWILFIPAYFFQTEKFYDISGSLNYIIIISYIYYNSYITYGFNKGNLILSLLIIIWAIRLGSFLFIRIQNDGEDKRTLEEIAKRYRVSLSTHMRQLALKDVIENESKF